VVIKANDGIYMLQLNAEGPDEDKAVLAEATAVIDNNTTIAPS
jgi:Probable lipoprotein LpqN